MPALLLAIAGPAGVASAAALARGLLPRLVVGIRLPLVIRRIRVPLRLWWPLIGGGEISPIGVPAWIALADRCVRVGPVRDVIPTILVVGGAVIDLTVGAIVGVTVEMSVAVARQNVLDMVDDHHAEH